MLINIKSNQGVLVLKDGVAVSFLRAGRYRYWLDARLNHLSTEGITFLLLLSIWRLAIKKPSKKY